MCLVMRAALESETIIEKKIKKKVDRKKNLSKIFLSRKFFRVRKKKLTEKIFGRIFFGSKKFSVDFFFDRPKKLVEIFSGLEKICKVIIVRVAVPPSEATIVRVVRVVRV